MICFLGFFGGGCWGFLGVFCGVFGGRGVLHKMKNKNFSIIFNSDFNIFNSKPLIVYGRSRNKNFALSAH